MKNKHFRIALSVGVAIILFGGFIFGRMSINNVASDLLVSTETLVQKQTHISSTIENEISSQIQVYLDPYEISPLSALITFMTEQETEVKMTLKGQHGSPDLVQTFEKTRTQVIPVYGLYANSTNEIILSYNNQEEIITIETEAVPEDFTLPSKTYINEKYADQLNDDFYFLTPASVGYTSGFDKNGNVRWYLTEELVWEIRTLNNGNLVLSNEKLINPPYYTTGFYEMDMLGNIKKEYVMPGGYHHDLAELPNGNLLVASNDFEYGTVEDVFVEIDRETGDIIRSVNLRDILEVEGGRSENWTDFDWFHNNSIWYDEASNSITLSGRHQDLVVNLDYDTFEINYLLGDPEGYSEAYQKHFLKPIGDIEWQYAQHAAKILPNGNLFLFDNGVNRSKDPEYYLEANDNYSRGVIFDVNQEEMSVSQVFEYGKERESDYYSSYISDVDYISDNHYLIHSGGVAYNNGDILNQPPGLSEYTDLKSYTSEVIDNELAFELELANNYYRAEKMNIYSNNQHLVLDYAHELGTIGQTLIDDSYYSFFPNIKNDPSILEAYDINIEHDGLRTIVSGNFNKDDKVSILLYKKFKMTEYKVRISERPYTAMCLVVFDDQQQAVTKYINDNYGLNGDYTILIQINDQIYATNKRVAY